MPTGTPAIVVASAAMTPTVQMPQAPAATPTVQMPQAPAALHTPATPATVAMNAAPLPAAIETPKRAPDVAKESDAKPRRVIDARKRFAQRSAWWLAAGVLVASAAALPFVLRGRGGASHGSTQGGGVAVNDPWRGTLAAVVSAGGDSPTSIEIRRPGAAQFEALRQDRKSVV